MIMTRHARQKLRRFFANGAADTSGAAAIEFGILVPLFGLMVISVADIGLGVYRKMQVEDAAQAGAQYAIARGFDTSGISGAVTSAVNSTAVTASPTPIKFYGCLNGTDINVVPSGTSCPDGTQARTYTTVYAQGNYSTLFNYGVVPEAYTINAQSTVRLQ